MQEFDLMPRSGETTYGFAVGLYPMTRLSDRCRPRRNDGMLTTRELNRATLARQLLLRREALDVAEAVRRVVALQAQHAASPYLALWNRIAAFDPADLDAAFTDRKIVKATLLRITLHAVHADDHPHIHEAMQPSLRAARLGDPRFTSSGITPTEADALVGDLLAFAGQPRSADEIQSWIQERLDVPPKGVWWALRTYAPLLHAATGAPWSFGARPAYVAAGIPLTLGAEADQALQTLVLRYLAGVRPGVGCRRGAIRAGDPQARPQRDRRHRRRHSSG